MDKETTKKIAALEVENQFLKSEIQRLQQLLDCTGIQYAVPGRTQDIISKREMPEGIVNENLTTEQIDLFITLFHGRTDVYARRFICKAGNVGYTPGCNNFWRQVVCPKRDGQKIKCFDCPNRNWTKLNRRLLREHLEGHKPDGTDVIGVYPMLADETCKKEFTKIGRRKNYEAIIPKPLFYMVQEEMAKRASMNKSAVTRKKNQKSKYSAMYALAGKVICGECGHEYRRVTWARNGKKKILWRCTERLENGVKNCKNFPTVPENILDAAVMNAIQRIVQNEQGLGGGPSGRMSYRCREAMEELLNLMNMMIN